MTKFLMTAAMAVALAGAGLSAQAQPPNDPHQHDKGGNPGGGHPPPGGGQNHGAPAPGHGGPPPGGHGGPPAAGATPQVFRGGPPAGNATPQVFFRGGAPGSNAPQRFQQQQAGPNGFHGGPAPGGGRGGPAGMGFQQHGYRPQDQGRRVFREGLFAAAVLSPQRYRAPAPYYPGGWYYRHWGYGDYLPYGWFGPSYYLNWGYYGLPDPPVGCEWVREGPDALLVDIWSGQVLSVYSNVFW